MSSSVSSPDSPLYLGLDLSTQSLTAVAVDASGHLAHTHSINFEERLTHHLTPVHRSPPFATTPSALFLEALDVLFADLTAQKFPFEHVRGISGAAQQHGSVYLSPSFLPALQALSPEKPLLPQFPPTVFSFPDGPIWEDSSTGLECALLEDALGGAGTMAAVTGARATMRFSGPQMLARARRAPTQYARTARVSLISAFVASVLVGQLAPEDVADASGTHLFALHSDPPGWLAEAVEAAHASGLLAGAPARGGALVGAASAYFCARYGFAAGTPVAAFTGDNPAAIASLGGIPPRALLVSLGTSDTAQWAIGERELPLSARGAAIAVTFRSPLSAAPAYFRMLVYANGSLTRERVRDARYGAGADAVAPPRDPADPWPEFEQRVREAPPGCSPPRVACFYLRPEIAPRVPAAPAPQVLDARSGMEVGASHAELCRLVLEWRAISLAVHLGVLGEDSPEKVLLTGGAADSGVIPQILADVLNAPVYRLGTLASAALGAARLARVSAMRAEGKEVSIVPDDEEPSVLVAEPRPDLARMYREVHIPAYQKFVERY